MKMTLTSSSSNTALSRAARRITVGDVAEASGVSATTVSYVLSGRDGTRISDGTRQRIVETAASLGYRRNALGSALRSGRTNTIGIIAPVNLMTSPPGTPGAVYFKDLVLFLSAAAFEAGFNPMFMSEDPTHKISLSDLADRRVDGVILFAKVDVQKFVQEARDYQVPCVTIGSEYGDYRVSTDHFKGAGMATEHLLELGHRKIGYLWSGKNGFANSSRREGYQHALQRAGLAVRAEWEIGAAPATIRTLLCAPDRPTAFFCYNEELAVVLLDICHELKIQVPQDLSIVGFDDTILAVMARPQLTTIHSPLMELSQTAVELLHQQIRGESCSSEPVFVAPSLVKRDSTCLPPELALANS